MQPIPSNPIGLNRANHVGISVSDLDASIRFYEALTGTKIVNKDVIGGPRMAAVQGLPKVLIRYANVHLANLNIDLLQYDEPKVKKASYDNSDIGAMHLCFEVDDLDDLLLRELREDDRVVDPVEELRPEALAYRPHHRRARRLHLGAIRQFRDRGVAGIIIGSMVKIMFSLISMPVPGRP